MLFQPKHIPWIRTGRKTVTRRAWADRYNRPRPGSIHQATTELYVPDEECNCYIRILPEYEQGQTERLGDMNEPDVAAEGYESHAAFRAAWRDLHGEWNPDQEVDVVPFQYVGRERPVE